MSESGEYHNDSVMRTALMMVVRMWEREELGIPPPTTFELEQCKKYLAELPYGTQEITAEVGLTLGDLLCNNISKHFYAVASHRKHLSIVYNLCNIANVCFLGEDMGERVKLHDLSKYGPLEAMGYSIMFGPTGNFRELQGKEKDLWEKAVASHFKSNPHHPQHTEDGLMKKEDLVESLLDMMACRLERTLKGKQFINASQLMNIPKEYLWRYQPPDRVKVEQIIDSWRGSINHLAEVKHGMDMFVYISANQLEKLKKWELRTKYVLCV